MYAIGSRCLFFSVRLLFPLSPFLSFRGMIAKLRRSHISICINICAHTHNRPSSQSNDSVSCNRFAHSHTVNINHFRTNYYGSSTTGKIHTVLSFMYLGYRMYVYDSSLHAVCEQPLTQRGPTDKHTLTRIVQRTHVS